jgi:hypothetical protein
MSREFTGHSTKMLLFPARLSAPAASHQDLSGGLHHQYCRI